MTTLFFTREEAAAHPETINGRAALLPDDRLRATFGRVWLRASEPPLPPRWPFPEVTEESCLHPWCYGWLAANLIEEQLKRDLIGNVSYQVVLRGATLRDKMLITVSWLGIERGARIPRTYDTFRSFTAWQLWSWELRALVDRSVNGFMKYAHGVEPVKRKKT